MHACMLSHSSRVQLFATLWTVAHQAPLSMGFSRQEYWSGLPCPPPRNLPDSGIEPEFVMAGRFFTTSTTWEAHNGYESESEVSKSCLSLCNPTDHSSPGSSVHGILQARILEWVTISYSRGSSQSRDWTRVSYVSCIGRRVLTTSATWDA